MVLVIIVILQCGKNVTWHGMLKLLACHSFTEELTANWLVLLHGWNHALNILALRVPTLSMRLVTAFELWIYLFFRTSKESTFFVSVQFLFFHTAVAVSKNWILLLSWSWWKSSKIALHHSHLDYILLRWNFPVYSQWCNIVIFSVHILVPFCFSFLTEQIAQIAE